MHRALKGMEYNISRYKVWSPTIYYNPINTICETTKYKFPYLLSNLPITKANHVWAIDVSFCDSWYIYSRYVVGWSVSNSMTDEWVVNTINKTILRYGLPKKINSCQGNQFTSGEYINFLKENRRYIGKGRATNNSFIERFLGRLCTLKYI